MSSRQPDKIDSAQTTNVRTSIEISSHSSEDENGLPSDLEKGNHFLTIPVAVFTPDDPSHPFNWPLRHKLAIAIIISLGGLMLTMGTSMMAPALLNIGHDLQLSSSATQLALSIYVLAQGFGPLIIAPLSEMYGRKPVWIGCSLFFILWNSLCPVNNSKGLMFAGRFFSGFGGSVGSTLIAPTMADIFHAEHRGKSFAISTFAPYLGAAIGPIVGGYVSQNIGWPWLFWVVSIFDSILVLLGAFLIRETYIPLLFARISKKGRQTYQLPKITASKHRAGTLFKKVGSNLATPIKLFFRRPIIPLLSVLLAYNWGVYILSLSTFSTLWVEKYHESESTSGLHYIAIALGSTIASQVGGPIMDILYSRLQRKLQPDGSQNVVPEYRAPLMLPGCIFMSSGLFWYGWSAAHHLVWVMPDIGICMFSCGVMLQAEAMIAYLMDEFAPQGQAASANAATRMLSNVFGFVFPLFAPKMYDVLGYGWGTSLLGFVSLGVGLPATWVLWKFGPKIRALGREIRPL